MRVCVLVGVCVCVCVGVSVCSRVLCAFAPACAAMEAHASVRATCAGAPTAPPSPPALPGGRRTPPQAGRPRARACAWPSAPPSCRACCSSPSWCRRTPCCRCGCACARCGVCVFWRRSFFWGVGRAICARGGAVAVVLTSWQQLACVPACSGCRHMWPHVHAPHDRATPHPAHTRRRQTFILSISGVAFTGGFGTYLTGALPASGAACCVPVCVGVCVGMRVAPAPRHTAPPPSGTAPVASHNMSLAARALTCRAHARATRTLRTTRTAGMSYQTYLNLGGAPRGTPGFNGEAVYDPEPSRTIPYLLMTAVLGVFMLTQMRKLMIIDWRLPFPSGTASGIMLSSFHTAVRQCMCVCVCVCRPWWASRRAAAAEACRTCVRHTHTATPLHTHTHICTIAADPNSHNVLCVHPPPFLRTRTRTRARQRAPQTPHRPARLPRCARSKSWATRGCAPSFSPSSSGSSTAPTTAADSTCGPRLGSQRCATRGTLTGSRITWAQVRARRAHGGCSVRAARAGRGRAVCVSTLSGGLRRHTGAVRLSTHTHTHTLPLPLPLALGVCQTTATARMQA
jgi:hypothetical protein